MTEKKVPLYFGEGPNRVLVGTAEVDGANVRCSIDYPNHAQLFGVGLQHFYIDFPGLRKTDSVKWLSKPIYKESPVADEKIAPKPIQDRIDRAINMVVAYFNSHSEITDGFELTANEVYVVWFNSTLNNWKAMVSTTIPDGMYYEVTYNWAKGETYVDAYKKFNNVCVKDEPSAPTQDPLPVSFHNLVPAGNQRFA